MPEMGELVNVVAGNPEDDNKCWFPHFPPDPAGDNKWDNSSGKLRTSLGKAPAEQLYLRHLVTITMGIGPPGGGSYTAKYNPHHLLPGEASWPNTALKKWVETEPGHVRDNIGYNVNCYQNGLDLPAHSAMSGNWTGQAPEFQSSYAFAAMDADTTRRQFHDSHGAYSDFATKVLDKIAAKLDKKVDEGKDLGCGHKNCPANKVTDPRYPTPFYVIDRIHGASARLSSYLYGGADKWRKPIFTSKFALMYQNRGLTHAQARDELNPDNFTY